MATPSCGVSLVYLVAITEAGATPCSTQSVSALNRSCCGSKLGAGCWIIPPNALGPGPAWQCHIPGAMNRRANCCVRIKLLGELLPNMVCARASKWLIVLGDGINGSAQPA